MPKRGSVKDKLLEAALTHFKSEKLRSEANLNVYLVAPAGIGDHPDLVGDVIVLTKKIAESEECIRIVKRLQEKK